MARATVRVHDFVMRAFLATALGAACTAAVALPLTLPGGARAAGPAVPASGTLPGSTQSLPLSALETPGGASAERAAPGTVGLPARQVRPFSLVGVVWDDPDQDLHGRIQVRTRATGGDWSAWQDVMAHTDDGPDPDAPEGHRARRGSSAPLWVGASDAVQLRVTPHTTDRAPAALPEGLRLELVDPGEEPPGSGGRRATAHAPSATTRGVHRTPAPDAPTEPAPDAPSAPAPEAPAPPDTTAAPPTPNASGTGTAPGTTATQPAPEASGTKPAPGTSGTTPPPDPPSTKPTPGTTTPTPGTTKPAPQPTPTATPAPQRPGTAAPAAPAIVSRAGWGADESLRTGDPLYTKTVRAAFVHHSATGNNYSCAEAPAAIRAIYRFHVKSSGWRDIGYNFLVDKCGTVYEGRAGGVGKPVMGAHTLGFNDDSTGIAVLGTYETTPPAQAALDSVAALAAWKLGLNGIAANGKTTLVSAGGNRFAKGSKVTLHTLSGHRDGFSTACPGKLLYDRLPALRTAAAARQGR